MKHPEIGTLKNDIDTPILCVDLDRLESNIRSMADTCKSHGVAWRPHCKCHKSSIIAKMQIDAGAIGITCAKLGEAEVMAAGGVNDLLIANLIVGQQKLDRLVELRRIADPVVCVDHLDQAQAFSAAISKGGLNLRTIIEVDIGLNRVGVEPGAATVQLAQQLSDMPGIEFSGIMGYEGHLLTVEDQQEKTTRIHQALDTLVQCKNEIESAGIECEIVSCGGTGSYFISVEHPKITELQAGGGIFMDAFYRNICQVPDLQYAVTVTTSVVSRPTRDRAIIDAGRKTLNQELHRPLVKDHDDITVEQLSAEHGRLQLANAAQELRIGDRLELIPGYVDFTSMLHNFFYVFRNDRLEAVWPIEARGMVR